MKERRVLGQKKMCWGVCLLTLWIPNHRCIFFDNLFLTLRVLLLLQVVRTTALTSFCFNHITRWPLASEKDLKKTGHGSFDNCIDLNFCLRMVKWFENDNKGFFLGSTSSSENYTQPRSAGTQRKKMWHTWIFFKEYSGRIGEADPNDVLVFLNFLTFSH